jgi:N-hydroxyarylamine O-acetyltransferase
VLEKLGLASRPATDLAGLGTLYAAWCRRVPFDNVRKLIHLREGLPGPLPGDDPVDFLETWLAHGTGGTCWAGNGALWFLLSGLGFDAQRGCGTMLVAPDLPPNHGTVCVGVDGAPYLVDASMLFADPLPLSDGSRVDHPAWGVDCRADAAQELRITWRPFHMPALECRIDFLGASAEQFGRYHEASRGWGPFNYSLSARLNRGDGVIGAAFGQHAEIDARGALSLAPADRSARRQLLVDRLGISEEMAERLPDDLPLPPPPKAGA